MCLFFLLSLSLSIFHFLVRSNETLENEHRRNVAMAEEAAQPISFFRVRFSSAFGVFLK